MGNCLVTKLKGSVDNPDLVQLGHYRVSVRNFPEAMNISSVGTDVSLVSGNARIFNYQDQELQFPLHLNGGSYYKIVVPDGEVAVLDVSNKYIEGYIGAWLECGTPNLFTMQDLEYFPQLTRLDGHSGARALLIDFISDRAAGRSYPKYTHVDFRCDLNGGDIADIPILFPNTEGENNGAIFFNPNQLNGSVESFINNWRSIGKTAGVFPVGGWVRNSHITFNGHDLSDTSYDNMTISWTATTMTITRTNGNVETINA